MLIQSNILEVIGNLEKYQRELPAALARALAPKGWLPLLQTAAGGVLRALAASEPDEETRAMLLGYVDQAVATITGTINGDGGSTFRMSVGGRGAAVGVQTLLPGSGGQYDKLNVPEDQRDEFRQKLYDWVATEKRWDVARDGEYSPENIQAKTEWLEYILMAPSVTAAEQEARDGFMPHIIELLTEGSGGVLDARTARVWLETVLVTWRDLAVVELPDRLRKSLNQLAKSYNFKLA